MNAWKFIKQHRNNIVCYGSLTLVFVLFAILTKGKIYSAYNLKSLVGQMVVLMIISIGMIFMFAHGTVDIASGAVAGLCTMVITLVLNATGNVPVAVLASGGGAVSVHVVRHSLPGTDEYYCFPGGHVHRQGYGDLHSVSA